MVKILVVENEEFFAQLIGDSFRAVGYKVIAITDSGKEAISIATKKHPDVILMDIGLEGEMSGIEAVREINAQVEVPIVYLTAAEDEETLQKAKSTSPYGYVIKPFKAKELRMTIDMAIYKHKMDKALELSKASFSNVVERSGEGVVVVDQKRKVLFLNSTAERQLGVKREQWIGKKFDFPKNEEQFKEIEIKLENGSKGIGELRYVNSYWEKEEAFLISVLDITQRKLHEQEKFRLLDKLQKSNQDILNFLKIASHDLKEPLRKSKTFSDQLLMNLQNDTNGTSKDVIYRIQAALTRMQILLTDLFEYSRYASVETNGKEIDLTKLVNKVLKQHKSQLEEVQAKVVIDELPIISGNEEQIYELFKQLINNSIKFNHSRMLKLNFKTKEDKNNYQVIAEDNGIGFDNKYAKQIFVPFKRLVTANEYEGTGIGLAICELIMRNHEGNIEAEGSKEKGSKFILTFPK